MLCNHTRSQASEMGDTKKNAQTEKSLSPLSHLLCTHDIPRGFGTHYYHSAVVTAEQLSHRFCSICSFSFLSGPDGVSIFLSLSLLLFYIHLAGRASWGDPASWVCKIPDTRTYLGKIVCKLQFPLGSFGDSRSGEAKSPRNPDIFLPRKARTNSRGFRKPNTYHNAEVIRDRDRK